MKKIVALLVLTSVILIASSYQSKKTHAVKTIEQIRFNLSDEPATMDPRKGGDVISSHMHFLLFEGLTRLNQDGSISLAQAESLDISTDAKTYTFHLRDAFWSNGDPVTANDFEKSWKDILDPQFPSVNAHLLYPIQNAEAAKKGLVSLDLIGVKAIDNKTLVVTLEKPTPYFLDLTAFCVLFPVHHTTDRQFSNWAYNAGENFISNGPYVLKTWKHHDQIIAEKNPFYWRKDDVIINRMNFSMIKNEMTALTMFEKGELDVIGLPLSPIPVDALLSFHKKGKLHRQPIGATTMIAFNTQKFPFNNKNIRKAFSYAIHREEIVQNITQLNEKIATNAIPPILKKEKERSFFNDHDTKKAQELLALGLKELGITKQDLQGIVYLYNTTEVNHKLAQAIQQQWAKTLGIQVKLENTEQKTLLERMSKRNFTMAQHLWVAQYNDQMNILERFKSKENVKNYASWENPVFAQILDKSAFETGEERLATLEKAEEIFLEEMPIAPLYHWDFAFMIQPHLEELQMSPIGDIYFERISAKKAP